MHGSPSIKDQIAAGQYEKWVISLNSYEPGTEPPKYDNTKPTPYAYAEECSFWNNSTSDVAFAQGEKVICYGKSEVVQLRPADTYIYKWYTDLVGGTPINTGTTIFNSDTCTILKNDKRIQKLYVESYLADGSMILSPMRDVINIYMAPDTLVWTGLAGTPDWNNPYNWYNPYDSDPPQYIYGQIPRKCTNVLIPNGLYIYPVLDDVFVYTRLFDKTNPETGSYSQATWTGTFNTPDILLSSGLGLSVWVDDKQPDVSKHNPFSFYFPKSDIRYNYYAWNGSFIKPGELLDRTSKNRFVYETIYGMQSATVFDLNTEQSAPGLKAIVGNPFMSHLDFGKFYNENSTYIKDFYYVLNSSGSLVSYDLSTGISTAGLTQYIAPMQSILVESRIPFPKLTADIDLATVNKPESENRLKSTAQIETLKQPLYIEASQNDTIMNRTALIYNPEGREENSIPKLFPGDDKSLLNVYTLSSSGKALDIHQINDFSGIIPIGLRTSVKGTIRMFFKNLPNFATEYNVYLNEYQNGVLKQTSLREEGKDLYVFEKISDNLYENSRFFLSFKKLSTGIETVTGNQGSQISIITENSRIKVFTQDNSALYKVTLCDLWGRIVFSKENIGVSMVEIPVDPNEIYILKAVSENETLSKKIYKK